MGRHMVVHCKGRSPGSCLTGAEVHERFEAIEGGHCVSEVHDDLGEQNAMISLRVELVGCRSVGHS